MGAVSELSKENPELNMTPMIDVSFLLIIFFVCLPMKTLEGKIAAFLPTDKGINPTPQEPPIEIRVTVHIVGRAEEPKQYPPPPPPNQRWPHEGLSVADVAIPSQFKYKIGDTETDKLGDVAAYIQRAYDAARGTAGTQNAKVLGEIQAGHKVPHKYVIAVLNKFAEAGMEKVDFYGTQVPTQDLRKKKFLPYPTTRY
jgi:biopolymer transport protein ExbD